MDEHELQSQLSKWYAQVSAWVVTVPQNITYIKATVPTIYSRTYSWCLKILLYYICIYNIYIYLYIYSICIAIPKHDHWSVAQLSYCTLLREGVTGVLVLDSGKSNPSSLAYHANKPSANGSNLHPSILGVSWGYYPVSDFVIIFANVTRWKDIMYTRRTAGGYLKQKLLG